MFKKLIRIIFFTLLIRPLSVLWPKKKNRIAFFPREGTRFIDNVAHFYDQLANRDLLPSDAYLLVSNKSLLRGWEKRGRKVQVYNPYNPKYLFLYLGTNLIVTDSWQWASEFSYSCFYGAKKVQIWHGIPLKKIELSNLDQKRTTALGNVKRVIMDWVHGRYPKYDIVVSTSNYFSELAFKKSFKAKKLVASGYPRNDVLLSNFSPEKTNLDIDHLAIHSLLRLKQRGKKIVVYSPTFRDSGGNAFDGALNLIDLEEFCAKNNIVFVIKFHPYIKNRAPNYVWPHIIAYDVDKDVTPLLQLSDILVTDYSSVYFDYLLTNKPIVFFPFDFEKYIQHDRPLLFDYNEFTPGIKCYTQEDLFHAILSELKTPSESWSKKRKNLQEISFKHVDGSASLRLWKEIASIL